MAGFLVILAVLGGLLVGVLVFLMALVVFLDFLEERSFREGRPGPRPYRAESNRDLPAERTDCRLEAQKTAHWGGPPARGRSSSQADA